MEVGRRNETEEEKLENLIYKELLRFYSLPNTFQSELGTRIRGNLNHFICCSEQGSFFIHNICSETYPTTPGLHISIQKCHFRVPNIKPDEFSSLDLFKSNLNFVDIGRSSTINKNNLFGKAYTLIDRKTGTHSNLYFIKWSYAFEKGTEEEILSMFDIDDSGWDEFFNSSLEMI